jgi:SOS-response transcriptional repressor LexA
MKRTIQAIRDRIRALFPDIAVSEIARRIGQPRHNVANYLSQREPSIEFLIAVCRTQNISPTWLLLGKGPMHLGEPDWSTIDYEALQEEAHRQRLELERNLRRIAEAFPKARETMSVAEFSRRGAAAGLLQVNRIPKVIAAEELPADEDWRPHYVPIINDVAAGVGVDTLKAESLPPGAADSYVRFEGAPKGAFAITVKGASMQPDFQEGDLVIVDPSRHASSGHIAVVLFDDRQTQSREAMVKRFRKRAEMVKLESLNPRFPALVIPASQFITAFEIFGHVSGGRESQ